MITQHKARKIMAGANKQNPAVGTHLHETVRNIKTIRKENHENVSRNNLRSIPVIGILLDAIMHRIDNYSKKVNGENNGNTK